MSGITKEEMQALVDSNNKVAIALERIVTNQETLIDKTTEVVNKLSNGINSEIGDVKIAVCGTESLPGVVAKISEMSQNAHDIKVVVGIVGIAIVICVAIMQFLSWVTRPSEVRAAVANALQSPVSVETTK